MQIMGYNRLINTEGDKTVLLLSSDDFYLDVEGTLRIRDNLRGYLIDVCLIPKTLKDAYISSPLIELLHPNTHIGDKLITQFLLYDEDRKSNLFRK